MASPRVWSIAAQKWPSPGAKIQARQSGQRVGRARHPGRRIQGSRRPAHHARDSGEIRRSRHSGQQCRLGTFKKLVDFDLASFERTFATNVTGAMLMAREAAKHFVSRNRGNIVNIGSTASHRGAPNGTAYYASKFALRGMTECWRQELRKNNIRVFLVNPSEVVTSFGAAAGFEQKDNPSKLRPEDIAHAVKSVLEMEDRGFVTELTVFATNPVD